MAPAQRVITVDQLRAMGPGVLRMPGDNPNKFRAQRQKYEGHGYDSKSELAFEFYLRLLKAQRVVDYWMRQVPFHLPEGRKYVADFVVKINEAHLGAGFDRRNPRILDIKGKDTPASALKRDWVKAHFGQTVDLVKAKSDGSYSWMP